MWNFTSYHLHFEMMTSNPAAYSQSCQSHIPVTDKVTNNSLFDHLQIQTLTLALFKGILPQN